MVGAGMGVRPPGPRHQCGTCASTAVGAAPEGWRVSVVFGLSRCPRCVASERAQLFSNTFRNPEGGRVRRRQRSAAELEERERVAVATPPADVADLVARVRVTMGPERRALVEQIVRAHPHAGAQRVSEWCGGVPPRRTVSSWRRRLVEAGEVSAIGPGGMVIE